MAQDDIYEATLHYEGPTQASSCSLYFQEDGLSTSTAGPVQSLNDSFLIGKALLFRGVLSNDWKLNAIRTRRVTGAKIAPHLLSFPVNVGSRTGPALPANNCLLMQLLQGLFPRTSNGRLYLPGLAEADTDVGVVEPAFLNLQVVQLGDALVSQLAESQGSGSWTPGVISAKVRDAVPGTKDWEGAFSQIVAAIGNPVIARQRRRTTRIIGHAA